MTTRIIQAPAYQKPSGKMYLGSNQLNLVNGAITLVELDTVGTGFTDGIEDTANHKITPGYAGFYIIIGMVTFMNLVIDRSYDAGVLITGAAYLPFVHDFSGRDDYYTVPVSCLVKLNATDYIELYARSMSGDNTVDILAGEAYTFLSIQRVRWQL